MTERTEIIRNEQRQNAGHVSSAVNAISRDGGQGRQ
jgi:hypothetical protein